MHGYSNGAKPYQGPNRIELRRAVGSKRLWQSEYGDGDASGYTMTQAIIHDIKELGPSAWIYWQPVEPDVREYGWGLVNANYIDTHDQLSAEKTPLVRVNRKFYVYGQFTRYLRPGYQLIDIDDANSIAAYDRGSHTLVIIKVTGEAPETMDLDLSSFSEVGNAIQEIATTTAPGDAVPDWKQHIEIVKIQKRRDLATGIHPKSIYTFVIEAVLRSIEHEYTCFRQRTRKLTI